MKQEKNLLTIKEIRHLNCTYLGCPRFALIVVDEQGNEYKARTADNASVGHFLGLWAQGKTFLFAYHYTRNGSMIIDFDCTRKELTRWKLGGFRERYAMRYGKAQDIGNALIR